MKIWLITIGEPLPLNGERPQRIGTLAKMLAEKGHCVTWWTSTLDHQSKSLFYNEDKAISVSDNLEIILMHSRIQYKKNVSLRRILHHQLVARKFNSLSQSKKKPDIILCSFPTIDLSYAAVEFGKRNSLPVIIDIRDLWPDIFVTPFPEYLHPIIRFLLRGYVEQTKEIVRNCFSMIAVSKTYLEWGLRYGHRGKTPRDKVFPLGYQKSKMNEDELSHNANLLLKVGIDPLKKSVWYVGTFGQTYDLATIIKSARKLEKTRKDIQFILTGDGEKKEEWLKLADQLNNVIFTGWVGKSQLAYLSSIADIGLMAYSHNAPQGLPNKIFEYMSAGIPILSSLRGETKDFLSEHQIGFSYEPNDVESFIGRLTLLIDDSLLSKEMGSRGKALFEREYSADVVYKELISYIENQVLDTQGVS